MVVTNEPLVFESGEPNPQGMSPFQRLIYLTCKAINMAASTARDSLNPGVLHPERLLQDLQDIHQSGLWWAKAIRRGDRLLTDLGVQVRRARITTLEPVTLGEMIVGSSAIEVIAMACHQFLSCASGWSSSATDERNFARVIQATGQAITRHDLDLLEVRANIELQRLEDALAKKEPRHTSFDVSAHQVRRILNVWDPSKALITILKSLSSWTPPHDAPAHEGAAVEINEVKDRRAVVARARPQIEALLPSAMPAARRLDGTDGPLSDLMTDEFLHEVTVNKAIAQLGRIVTDAEQEDQVREQIARGASNKASELAEQFWGIEGKFMRLPGLTKQVAGARMRDEINESLLAELQQEPSGATRQPKEHREKAGALPESLECVVEKISPASAVVREGGTSAPVKGPRRVWLLMTVVNAMRPLTWHELVEADMNSAAEVLDRRIKSRSASGAAVPMNALGTNHRGSRTPKMATQAATLKNLGNRIRRDMGKLGYHWHQDGQGVFWSRDCQ